MKLPVRPLSFVSLLALVPLLTLACSSSDDGGSSSSSSGSSGASSGASSGGNTSSGNTTSSGAGSSGNAGTCTGDVSACTMGSLSDAQMTDTCSLILSAIDSPADEVRMQRGTSERPLPHRQLEGAMRRAKAAGELQGEGRAARRLLQVGEERRVRGLRRERRVCAALLFDLRLFGLTQFAV